MVHETAKTQQTKMIASFLAPWNTPSTHLSSGPPVQELYRRYRGRSDKWTGSLSDPGSTNVGDESVTWISDATWHPRSVCASLLAIFSLSSSAANERAWIYCRTQDTTINFQTWRKNRHEFMHIFPIQSFILFPIQNSKFRSKRVRDSSLACLEWNLGYLCTGRDFPPVYSSTAHEADHCGWPLSSHCLLLSLSAFKRDRSNPPLLFRSYIVNFSASLQQSLSVWLKIIPFLGGWGGGDTVKCTKNNTYFSSYLKGQQQYRTQ